MQHYLGIDLGGTNIAAALVDAEYRILGKASVPTLAPRPAEALCADMAGLCVKLAGEAGLTMGDIEWIGLGSPGIVWNGQICFASNLGLNDAPIARPLAEALGRPVYLANDANAAAFGEYVAGVGVDYQSLAAVTLGTGIGSGLIIDGRIHDGFNGAAAELGHVILVPHGRECACGNRGCFETYCSATGIIRSAREAMEANPASELWKTATLDTVNPKTVFDAANLGDRTALRVVEDFLDYLAIGVANVVNMLQPEIVCIGGGVSAQGDAIIVPLRERVRAYTFSGRNNLRTEIHAASLGNDAGLIGAALLGKLA